MNNECITAKKARKEAKKYKKIKMQLTVEKVNNLKNINPQIAEHIYKITKEISKSIENGNFSVCILLKDVDIDYKDLQLVVDILKNLGYKVDHSCSSNFINERLIINW